MWTGKRYRLNATEFGVNKMLESIKKEMLDDGLNPDDFNISMEDGVIKVVPKWYYEMKQIAKKEDVPIIDDMNAVAELTTITSMDKDELAEMLVFALQKIDELEERIDG